MKAWLARLGMRLLAWLAILAAAVAALGAVAAVVAYFVITPRSFDREAIETANRVPGVNFIDARGELLATRGAFHGDEVELENLPPYLIQAFIATEDRRFYKHWGLDPLGIMRAMLVNLRAGRTVQGGSTITQQLAKNLFLSNDRTLTRKVNELFYAVWLERHLTKDEILSLYLNRIYFGAGTYGVDAAARLYFGKPASKVSLAEAAMLAGLPKAPTRLAPTTEKSSAPIECEDEDEAEGAPSPPGIPPATQARASRVLDNLVDAGYMTEAEVFSARAQPAELSQRVELGSIQYYLDYVYRILGDVLIQGGERAGGGAPRPVVEGEPETPPTGLGLEDLIVYTTLDTGLQHKAECALLRRLDRDGELLDTSEGALVAIDPEGAVRAMVGGRSYIDSQFNRATDARRQPGSAFKPFVYLAALESGQFTPDTIVLDAPIDPPIMTPQGPWSPVNYSEGFRGRVTVREALAQSLNTATVRISEAIGPDKVAAAAHRLGIVSPLEPVHSIALGTQEVTLLELAGAYLPFERGGLSVPIHTVARVETKSGKLLYEYQAPEPTRVIDEQIAAQMTNLMFGVIYEGTGRAASLGGRPAAGKTGTSSDWRDAWFMGYTANLIAGVWVGNDDDSPMKGVTGGGLPAQVWKSFMSSAHEDVKVSALAGAYPSRGTDEESQLKSFYSDLAARLRAIETGQSPAAQSSAVDEPTRGEPRRRCFLFFCSED